MTTQGSVASMGRAMGTEAAALGSAHGSLKMDRGLTHAHRLDPPVAAQSGEAVREREEALIRRLRIARTLAVFSAAAASADVAVSTGVTLLLPGGRNATVFLTTFVLVALVAMVVGGLLLQRRFGR